MNSELLRYLNDHLAGSSGAVLLIGELAERSDLPEAKAFFESLRQKVESDRELLDRLIRDLGGEPSTILKAAGHLTARVGFLKLMWEGFEPGKLGMFEAMEMLALGVQGKRLLWVTLGDIAPAFPEWSGCRFSDLELQAIEQRDRVEAFRLEAARASFLVRDR